MAKVKMAKVYLFVFPKWRKFFFDQCHEKSMAQNYDLLLSAYYGIVKDEQWNYHLGKMYGCVCVCVCVISKISMLTNVQS
jgi:hypothetical protein